MSNHILFDDMVNLINGNVSADNFLEEVTRINGHLYRCDECMEVYSTLVELDDSVKRIRYIKDLEAKKVNAIDTETVNSIASEEVDVLTEMPEMPDFEETVMSMILSVSDMAALMINDMITNKNGYSFAQPVAMGYRGGNNNSGSELPANMLIDENDGFNRISLDGKILTIEFDADGFEKAPKVCVGKADKTVIASKIADEKDGRYIVSIELKEEDLIDNKLMISVS